MYTLVKNEKFETIILERSELKNLKELVDYLRLDKDKTYNLYIGSSFKYVVTLENGNYIYKTQTGRGSLKYVEYLELPCYVRNFVDTLKQEI